MSIRRKRLGRRILQVGLSVSILLGTLGLTGCKSYKEKLEEKIVQALEEKYEEPFVVYAIGGNWAGGFPNSSTIDALCYPEADSSLRFVVEIHKETYEVYDKYLNRLVGRNEEPYIQALASKVWANSTVTVTNDTVMTYPEENDKTMRNSEFLSLYSHNSQLVNVFISGEEQVNVEVEIEKIESLMNKLKGAGYESTYVSIIYLQPEYYNQIPEVKKETYDVDEYFDEGKKIYCRMGAEIKDGKVVLDKEQYIKNFKKYKAWGR